MIFSWIYSQFCSSDVSKLVHIVEHRGNCVESNKVKFKRRGDLPESEQGPPDRSGVLLLLNYVHQIWHFLLGDG